MVGPKWLFQNSPFYDWVCVRTSEGQSQQNNKNGFITILLLVHVIHAMRQFVILILPFVHTKSESITIL